MHESISDKQMAAVIMEQQPAGAFNNGTNTINHNVHVVSHTPWSKRLIGGVAAVAVAVVAYGAYEFFEHRGNDASNEGGVHAVVSVRHDTLSTVAINLSCSARASEYAGVNAIQHFKTAGFDSGANKVSKLYFNQFDLCGNDNQLQTSASVYKNKHGVAEVVTATFPLAEVEGAAPNLLAPENCVPLRPKDSITKINAKIKKYEAEKAAALADGKDGPTCDSGAYVDFAHFNVGIEVNTHLATNPLSDASAMAIAADELAIALDPYDDNQMKAPLAEVEQDEANYLQGEYPTAKIELTVPTPLSDEQKMAARLEDLSGNTAGIGDTFTRLIFKLGKNGTMDVYADESGNSSAEVILSDQTEDAAQVTALNAVAQQILTTNNTIPLVTQGN